MCNKNEYMHLNGFLFVYEEKRGISLVIFIIKLLITSILAVISSLSMCGVIYVGPKEVFNGTLEDNAIFLVY